MVVGTAIHLRLGSILIHYEIDPPLMHHSTPVEQRSVAHSFDDTHEEVERGVQRLHITRVFTYVFFYWQRFSKQNS